MKVQFALSAPRFMPRDNEGGSEEPSPQPEAQAPEAAPQGETMFTQDQVNEIVVKRNKKVREQLQQTEKQYESLLKSQNLSSKEKSDLKLQLEISAELQLRTKLKSNKQNTTVVWKRPMAS